MRRYMAGLAGKKILYFNGSSYVNVPNNPLINIGGPYPNRAIEVLFKCHDVSRTTHQVIWEEGGTGRGFNIYILNGRLYGGAWNIDETGWSGNWISTSVKSGIIYHVMLVLREATDEIEPDKLELWVNGELIGKEQGTQVYGHPGYIGVGAVVVDSRFHDIGGVGVDYGYYLYGEVYLVRVYNYAPLEKEIARLKNDAFNLRSTSIRKDLVLEFIPDTLDCTNGVWRDNSGHGNDGTIYGAKCIAV